MSDREDNLEDNREDNPEGSSEGPFEGPFEGPSEGRSEGRGYEEEDEELDLDSSVRVEISRLSLFTHHGATDAEQQAGQRLIFDIAFEVEDCDATVTDRLEDTIDYGAVCQAVALIATERSYRTLEKLCTAVADMIEERFRAAAVVVRATKPEPPIPLPVEEVSVEVQR